jgi:hypothetical protein
LISANQNGDTKAANASFSRRTSSIGSLTFSQKRMISCCVLMIAKGHVIVQDSMQPSLPLPSQPKRLFDGYTFTADGFDAKQRAILKSVLQENGAVLYNDTPRIVHKHYLIVPLNHATLVHSTVPMVTDLWLERCLDVRPLSLLFIHFQLFD